MKQITDDLIPDIEKVEESFKLLLDSSNLFSTSNEVIDFFFKQLIFIPRIAFPNDKIKTFKLFRIRKKTTIKKENLSDPLSFSFPPPEFCYVERANLTGKPVFYGCDNQFSAILETDIGKNEIFYLSEWTLTIHPNHYLFLLLFDNINSENLWYNISINMLNSLLKEFDFLSEKSKRNK
jgi:hypothetical protein